MAKDDLLYLNHILSAIDRVERYLRGVDLNRFFSDTLLQDAVLRQLEIVGEASARLSDLAKSQHPDIPWNQIVGMRNRLVHAYFDVNLDICWEVARIDLPRLKNAVLNILATQEDVGSAN